MKKPIHLSFFMLVCSPVLQAQTVNIPDANFVSYLTGSFPGCMSGSLMDTTCPAITSATTLWLDSWNVSNLEGVQYFDNLQVLNVSNNASLTTIPVLNSTLTEFRAENTPLSTMPAPLPIGLVSLYLKNNAMTSLPALPATLTVLSCNNLNLSSLPTLPSGMTFLEVQFNNLSSLPTLPTSLSHLNASANHITTLPTLPAMLQSLDVSSNLLTSLPTLPSTVFWSLNAGGNALTTLPALPASLTTLHVVGNSLTTLPTLPSGLTTFSCGLNNLTALPALPSGLQQFWCQSNDITVLPPLPNTLTLLYCSDNPLTSFVDTLPPNLTFLHCINNNISCFPQLPTGVGYSYTLFPNPATCLPNYGAWMSSTLLAYPLCVVGDASINPAGCTNGSGIYGVAYEDVDTDCAFTTGDNGIANIPFKLYDAGSTLLQQAYTTYTGNYYFNPGIGAYTVELDTTNMPFFDRVCGSIVQSVTLNTGTPVVSDIDFDLECNGNIDLGVTSVNTTGLVFPGQEHKLRVVAGDLSQWYGFNCAGGQSGQIVVTVNGPVMYLAPISGAAMPTVLGNTYTYTVSDYSVFDIETQIGLEFTTDTTATGGDTVCVTVAVTGTGTDVNSTNNNYDFCYLVSNSFDPNMKEVWPIDVEEGYTDFFTYTIHFQNTGTAPALHIVLRDTLDTNLDLSTFEMIGYSHNNQVTLAGNKLVVDFPNINLVDSTTDYYGSMGYFQYRIKPIAGLSAGENVKNTAHIFFDFNAPVVTNTTLNNFVAPTATIEESALYTYRFYPNPVNGYATLVCNNPLHETRTLVITDSQGRIVQTQNVNEQEKIEVVATQMDNGVYFFSLQANDKIHARGKYIVQH